jgi:hypothetical protein
MSSPPSCPPPRNRSRNLPLIISSGRAQPGSDTPRNTRSDPERPLSRPAPCQESWAQVNLHGNLYDVDPSLAGTRVELVFNPFDLTDIDVRAHSRSYGKATASQIRRHVHPKAEADTPPPPAPPTGIDYLRLIEDRHTRSLDNQLTTPTCRT